MTKGELIELLSAIPGNPEILIQSAPDEATSEPELMPGAGDLHNVKSVDECCADSPGYFDKGKWIVCPAFVVIYPDIHWWKDDKKFAEYETEYGVSKHLRKLRAKFNSS